LKNSTNVVFDLSLFLLQIGEKDQKPRMEQNYNLFQNRDIETHTPTFLSRRISLLILDFKGGTGGMANNKSSPHKAANFFVCMKNTDCQ